MRLLRQDSFRIVDVADLKGKRVAVTRGTDIVADCGWLVGSLWNTYGGVRPALS